MDADLNPVDYDRTPNQLERFLLFCMMVAGKRSDVTREKHGRLLEILGAGSPLATIRTLDGGKPRLEQILRHVKTGKYNLLTEGFWELSERRPNLATISEKKIRDTTGIGPKTAQFFLQSSRPAHRGAVLDTHVLRWLREEHGYENAPRVTPQDEKTYERYANIFLKIADGEGMSPAELDFYVWSNYAK